MALRHVEGPDQQSLTFAEVMKALGVSKGVLRGLIDTGAFPPGIRLGGRGPLRWPWMDVVAFLHLQGRLKPPHQPSENVESEQKSGGRRRPPDAG